MNFPEKRFIKNVTNAFDASLTIMRDGAVGYDEYNHLSDDQVSAIKGAIEKGALPPHDENAPNDSAMLYAFKNGNYVIVDALRKYLSDGSPMVNQYAIDQLTKTMPGGLPPDGSKGQWRVAKEARDRTLEWLLGKDYCEYLIAEAED